MQQAGPAAGSNLRVCAVNEHRQAGHADPELPAVKLTR